jgi:glycosyltransferase involved in cell wall biosynthesis
MQSSKPKLALLFNAFWINRQGMSGGDKRLIEIFSRIASGYSLDILTSQDGRDAMRDRIPKANFVLSSPDCDASTFHSAYVKRTIWARRRILEGEYDLVYGSSDFFPDVMPCALYKKRHPTGKWMQCVFHVYPPWNKRPGNVFNSILGTLVQRFSLMQARLHADLVVTLNKGVSRQLAGFGLNPDRLTVNPCGVDSASFASIDIRRLPFQACFLGRLVSSKGILDLPQIWKLVVAQLPQAKLKIIGNGPDAVILSLKSAIKDMNLSENIELCGYLPEQKAYATIKESSVFLFPSHEEGFGIAIAEALACETPVVAWDLPVFAELFPEGVVTVRQNDIQAFASATVKILNEPAYARQLAHKGHGIAAGYNWNSIAATENNLILKTLSKNSQFASSQVRTR